MWREVALVAGKDLRIEARTKVGLGQVVPFAGTVLVLFGLALDPDRGVLDRAAAGLFWVTVLLSTVLAVQRSFALESADGAVEGLRMSGLDPAAIYFGKAGALFVQLVLLEIVLAAGVAVLYDVAVGGAALLVLIGLVATAGLAAAATVYGALATGTRTGDTLLPLLLLPIAAPVLLAATRASEAALAGVMEEGWPWLRMLSAFAVIYLAAGAVAFGPLLEDTQ